MLKTITLQGKLLSIIVQGSNLFSICEFECCRKKRTKCKEFVFFVTLSNQNVYFIKIHCKLLVYRLVFRNNGSVIYYPFDGPSDFLSLFDCLDLKQQIKIATYSLSNYPSLEGGTNNKTEFNHALILRFANILASSVNALTISGE